VIEKKKLLWTPYPLISTNTISTAVFHLPDGATAAATKNHKLHHKLHEPACTVSIVPSIVGNSLLSTVKMVQAGYTAIYNDSEVNFYNSTTAMISVSEAAVLTGYVCPQAQLWHVPLVTTVRNKNTDTLLLNHPHKPESLNMAYTVESTSLIWAHIVSTMSVAHGNKYIHNVYKLPSIEPTIRYLHAAAGFPTKELWLRAIRRGNYKSWPLINVKNVPRHFPKLEEHKKATCTDNAMVSVPPRRSDGMLTSHLFPLNPPQKSPLAFAKGTS
jgi:hypothetical protein